MKELKVAILSQNHRQSQGGGQGGPGPLNQNATNDTNLTTKFSVSFSIFAYNSTLAQQ